MKILLVEDKPTSIENAQKQLICHELITVTTVFEFLFVCDAANSWGKYKFPCDIVVTDVDVPMGDAGKFGVAKHYKQTDHVKAGLVVAMAALIRRVPCYVITDANSHRDLYGVLLDRMPWEDDEDQKMLCCSTRPNTLANGGKDYTGVLKWLEACHGQKPGEA